MYNETQNENFHTSYLYWKEQTLKMAYHPDAPGGYKAFNPDLDYPWYLTYSFLEGIAGIGLFLMTETNSNWDEILLPK